MLVHGELRGRAEDGGVTDIDGLFPSDRKEKGLDGGIHQIQGVRVIAIDTQQKMTIIYIFPLFQ